MNQPDEFENQLFNGVESCHALGKTILVAVSGGADSVALLLGLLKIRARANLKLVAAHLNHCLRGNESDNDAVWVQELCDGLGVPLVIDRQDVAQLAGESTTVGVSKNGGEELARNVRYEFLLNSAIAQNCSCIATAHSADDQVETILHHILRGTSISGLTGMPVQRDLSEDVSLFRPMLNIRREQVEAFLISVDQKFRSDHTNQNIEYTRNRLRHSLLPEIRENINPRVDQALLRLSDQARELNDTLDELANSLLQQAVLEQTPTLCKLDCQTLSVQPDYLVRHCFVSLWKRQHWPRQRMGAVEWKALANLVHTSSGGRSFPGNIQASRRNNLLVLTQ